MKVFQLLMHNTEEHEYLHRGTHGSASLCIWKPKMQPTYSPPFFCQPKQPLSQFSARNPNTPVLSLRREHVVRPAHASEVRNSLFALPWKHPLKRQKKPNPALSVCVSNREPMWSEEIHSLPFILRQKRRAEWKGNWGAYWSCWVGL